MTIQWTYQGGSSEIIAMLHDGRFLPMPTFASRVGRVDDEGISLSHVTAEDSGNYTVVVGSLRTATETSSPSGTVLSFK